MRSLTVAFLLAAIAPLASAQPTIVRPGAKVRIDAPGFTLNRTEGVILTMTPDTITIFGEGLAPLPIPRAAIRELALSSGKDHWLGAQKGTRIGVEWGAGIGIVGAALSDETCTSGYGAPRTCSPTTFTDRVAVASLVTFAGAFYGAIIGAIAGSERWDSVEMPKRATIGLQNGRPALSWSVSF
jgi:hypothetical protein